ncbi:MAG: GNAT family N-acetyltransferase [Terrimicrobiaceae bacterium]|nr:GNAT family N-acetyltransferase [Terrimicrobiaceae bacterium]
MANDWQRFHWDLDKRLDAARPALPPFVFRLADESEREIVMKVVSSALMMERAWTGARTAFARDLKRRCEDALALVPPACVVVQHGSRVIGASVLAFSQDAEFHLLTGPCILHEYRSRGLGSALLHKSLERLREEGLLRVTATARVNSTAARYIYRKFGGVPEPIASKETPRLAA